MPVEPPLSVSDSALKAFNAALSLLGLPNISSFLDNNPQARVGNALAGNSIEAMLAEYPWRFARKQETMAASVTTAPAPWESMFTLPAETLLVRSVWDGDQKILFDVFGGEVATMVNTAGAYDVKAEVTYAPSVGQWPGYFRQAAITRLAADVCMPLTQDERFALQLEDKAMRQMAYAKTRDAQGRSPSRIDTKSFIRARRGGRH